MMTKQIWVTSFILLCSVALFAYSDVDVWVQDYFYNFELHQWFFDRHEKIKKFLFYDGMRKLFILFVFVTLTGLLFFRNIQLIKKYTQGLFVVCTSALLIPLVVGALKAETNTPCPKNITHYGGNYPYVTVLTNYPHDFQQTKEMKCYPAGHASGGFALLSLFFLFKKRRNKIAAVGFAMFVGWAIGTYKMMIGDHFLSHTVVTMILSWLIILMVNQGLENWPGTDFLLARRIKPGPI